ncbi:hypothetical protein PMI35_02981, partial [Pseudomonas sp. GM78]
MGAQHSTLMLNVTPLSSERRPE